MHLLLPRKTPYIFHFFLVDNGIEIPLIDHHDPSNSFFFIYYHLPQLPQPQFTFIINPWILSSPHLPHDTTNQDPWEILWTFKYDFLQINNNPFALPSTFVYQNKKISWKKRCLGLITLILSMKSRYGVQHDADTTI